jgi:signal transduction histidine kinase
MAVEAESARVLLLSDDVALRNTVVSALDHSSIELTLSRRPFDTALLTDAACILLDDASSEAALPVLNYWRQLAEFDRPPLVLLVQPGTAPGLPAALLDEIDGVVVPAYGAGLLRRVVATALENRRLHAELDDLGRFAALGKVLAGVLHELKNPLNNVLGGLDRLDGLVAINDQLARWREMVRRNGELLREALADLLNGFRGHLEPQAVELHPLLDRAVMFAIGGDINFRRQIAVDKKFADPAPIVQGNSGQLLHLLLNLLLNARQAIGDHNGAISLHTSWLPDGRICLEVQDSGPGIPEEMLHDLFKMRRTTKQVGTGFGLALAKEIVERHGGTISAANAASGGASFRVQLPASAEEAHSD